MNFVETPFGVLRFKKGLLIFDTKSQAYFFVIYLHFYSSLQKNWRPAVPYLHLICDRPCCSAAIRSDNCKVIKKIFCVRS